MQFDETKYNISKVKGQHGTQWVITEKYRACEGCKKVMEKDLMQLITWTDKDDYHRSLLVCRKCRQEAIELFKESETRFVQ